MATTTVRVSRITHAALTALADEEDVSIQAVLERLVSEYQKKRLLELGNEAYARLRNDPDAWTEEINERRIWDATLSDGLSETE
jgi:hypothetical protein